MAIVKSALLGALIALAGFLPPVVHFVTGPLGPVIGGIIAGYRVKATCGKAEMIGLLMGVFIAVPALLLLRTLFGPMSTTNLAILGFIIVGYTAVLGGLGAALGGFFSDKDTPQKQTPSHTS